MHSSGRFAQEDAVLLGLVASADETAPLEMQIAETSMTSP